MSQLLTVPEAGKRLGLSRQTVWRLVNGGHLRVVDVGSSGGRPTLRVREDDLLAFVESRTYDSGPAAAAARAARSGANGST